jgi:hypothetical protein
MGMDKPTIVVAIRNDSDDLTELSDFFNGIEEEEIPVSIKKFEFDSVIKRAYQAALSSHLSVGVGFDDNSVIVHYKNLHENEPLFIVDKMDRVNLRILGANAARLVKGVPFKKLN